MPDERDLRPVGTLTMDELFEEIQSRSDAAILCLVMREGIEAGTPTSPVYMHGAKVVLLGMDRVIAAFVDKACLGRG